MHSNSLMIGLTCQFADSREFTALTEPRVDPGRGRVERCGSNILRSFGAARLMFPGHGYSPDVGSMAVGCEAPTAEGGVKDGVDT